MKFKQLLIRAFELKPEEYTKFMLLFFHSFCLGLFIAFYFVPANSVFIKHFETEQLPLAYIASGIAGYLSTLLYSYLQKKVRSLMLFLGVSLFIVFVTLVGRFGLVFFDEKWLSFFVFVWAWPFISLVGTLTGGLAIRLLNLRQVKRLFGLINMGGVVASILGYLAIPFVSVLLGKWNGHPYDLLYIGVAGILTSILLLYFIYLQFPEKPLQNENEDYIKSTTSYRSLIKDRYFKLIFASAFLSTAVIYFSDFGFLASIQVQKSVFFSNEILVSNFLAVVYGVLKIGELVMSYFSSRILSKYGVRLGLSILPLTALFLTIIATIAGLTYGATGLFFFAFIVLNKTMERVLRRSLDDPSFNILYQPLPDEQKLSIQTKVGVIMQISIGLAGVLLLVITKMVTNENGFNLDYYTLLFLPILLIWVVTALKLYEAYKEKIRQILKERNRKKEKDTDIYGSDVLSKKLKGENVEIVERCVALLSETNPRALELFAVSLLNDGNKNLQKSILRNINPTYRQEFVKVLQNIKDKETDEEINILVSKALEYLDYSKITSLSQKELNRLLRSKATSDKLLLIKYLFLHKIPNDDNIIFDLLKEKDLTVNRAAIKLAGKRNSPILRTRIVEMLRQPEYSHIISSTILEIGEKIFDELESLFKGETPTPILLKVIEIYAKIGTPAAKTLLVGHINYADKDVQIAVIKALYFCQYQVNIKERPVIKQKLEEVCDNILWAFVSINDLEAQKNTLKLIQALDLEREHNFEIMFYLLSFIYQPATIDLIKTNIIGENTIFALEIIENFISPDIKQLIIPLLDKISVTQRMKKLLSYFPHQKMRFTDRLKDILIRDYNKVDLWTIAKTIELLGKLHRKKSSREVKQSETEYQNIVDIWTRSKVQALLNLIKKSEMPDEIFVCLYHPDELVYSTAAKIIYDENPTRTINNIKKLSAKKQELIPFLTDPEETKNLLIERVKLIKRVPMFFSVPENVLVKLVKLLKAKRYRKNERLHFFNEDKSENIFIVLRGAISYSTSDNEITFTKNDIIGRGSNVDISVDFVVVKKDALVLEGNKFEYNNLLVDEVDIIKPIFQSGKK